MASYSAIDPTFVAATLPGGSSGPNGAVIAVQDDGKVVEASTAFNFLNTPEGPSDYNVTTVYRFLTSGALDPSFGTNGKVVIPLPSGANGFIGTPHNLAIQDNGSIDLASILSVPVQGSTTASSVGLVAQLTKDGQLDPGFGTNGETTFTGTNDFGASVAAQAGNKVLVMAGSALNSSTPGVAEHNLILSRFNPDGTLDTSFNTTGTVAITFAPNTNSYYEGVGVVVDPTTGVITVAGNAIGGSALVQFNSDGTFHTAFGTGGTLTLPVTAGGVSPALNDLAVQADGSIVVVGTIDSTPIYPATSSGYLARVGTDGTVETAFGDAVASNPTLANVAPTKIAISTDGTITVAGNGAGSAINSIVVDRLLPTGAADLGFGRSGRYVVPVTINGTRQGVVASQSGLALTKTGDIVVSGLSYIQTPPAVGNSNVVVRLLPVRVSVPTDDFDGDGKSDIAAYLPTLGAFAVRPSAGGADVLTAFGIAGVVNSLLAPGDYDGDGKTDLAVYIPSQGKLYYRPSSGSPYDQAITIGDSSSIPAPGDYDGDGFTDAAVYDPTTGSFVIHDSSTGTTQTIQFGLTGPDASIPAPGEYDGDGITDLAVYIPSEGVYAYRPSSGGPDVLTSFGIPGQQATIPAPGDYDGDGKTDLAVYVPQYALYAYRPSGAVAASADIWTSFGTAGPETTLPVSSILYAQPATVAAESLAGSSAGAPDVLVAFGASDVAGLEGANLLAPKKTRAAQA